MKRITALIFCLVSVFVPLFHFAQAQSPLLAYGGEVRVVIPCTCTFNWWVFYAPLYPAPAPFPFVGALVITPGVTFPLAYPWFILPVPVPTTWQLGQYIPGAGICFIGVPPFCVPLPNWGHVMKAGASFPGFP